VAPGTIPATSQLDWPISITAISVAWGAPLIRWSDDGAHRLPGSIAAEGSPRLRGSKLVDLMGSLALWAIRPLMKCTSRLKRSSFATPMKERRGNKSATGWWLTANNRNTSHSIKVQSDGAKMVVTAEK
jgi:hypothetical protein